ncbi:MAG: glycosyltransferase [Bacteroidia bacterium]
MKKILCCVTNDLNFDQRMIKICSSLSKEGYDVTLTGRKLKSSGALQQQPYRQHRIYCFFTKGKLFYLEFNLRLSYFLIKNRYDVFCAVDLDTILPCLLYSGIRNKKLVYDAHEYFTEVPEVVARPIVQMIWQWVARISIPRADLCYTVSPSLSKIFEQKYQRPFRVIANVPYLKAEEQSNAGKEMFILYQGALNRGRALEPLIEAMPDLDMELHLVGDGDLTDELKKLVNKLNIGNKVKFLGRMRPEQLMAYTSKAWLGYNLLKREGLSYYYSLSNKFFDYIHSGVPVLCSPFPEYVRINEEFQVSCFSEPVAAKIVDSVNRLIDDPGLYHRLRENCLQARQVYHWGHEEKKLIRYYHGL